MDKELFTEELELTVPVAEDEETEQEELERLGPEKQFAVVELSGQSLAIDIALAMRILDRPQITEVPFTPEFIMGVANIRGDIYSVVDIRPLLDIAPRADGKEDPLVILLAGTNYTCGATIESITEIMRIREKQITEPSTDIPHISGIYRQGQDTILILDVEGLLSSPEMTQFQ